MADININKIHIPKGYALVRLDSSLPRQPDEEIAQVADVNDAYHSVYIIRDPKAILYQCGETSTTAGDWSKPDGIKKKSKK